MKRRRLACLLLVIFVIAGCNEGIQNVPKISQTAPTPAATIEIKKEVRPGIYISNDLKDFPFPASGYDVYVVGETHGNHETKQVFQTYLKSLYAEAGVRDVVLEEHPAYEPDANEYVLGKTDSLPEELCRRTDILGLIQEFNAKLPENEKVTVHLADVDSPLPILYKHLTDLQTRLGSKGGSIQIPSFSEIETWGPKSVYDLMDNLQSAAAGQPDILKELETLRLSFKWYFAGNTLDGNISTSYGGVLREDIITRNIQNLLSGLAGRPLLVFFGGSHAMKVNPAMQSSDKDWKPWAQQLNETGVDVYSLLVDGIAGSGYWRGYTFQYTEQEGQFQLEDGTFLSSLLTSHPDAGVIYTDLRTPENKNIKLPPGFQEIPASQVFDGLVIFKEFTPMENACKELK